MEVAIRHAEPADYDPIAAAVDDWWGGRSVTALLSRLWFIHFRPTSFVAEERGMLRGFLVGFRSQSDPNEAYVHVVGVAPEARGHGVGRLLYEHFFATVRALGCTSVSCVTAPVNTASITFHRRLGFDVLAGDAESNGVPVTAHYAGRGEARVLFRKQLCGSAPAARGSGADR